MSEKQVIAVIVEGPSDENAIGGILKEFFSSEEIHFAVVHGDITSDAYITRDNVISKINDLINTIKRKYGYHNEDFIRIIHIADTDGAFTKNCIVEANVDAVQYYENRIESANVEATEKRNKHKSEIMYKLYSTGKVNNIPYKLYFNSCNLEHVLYNELKNFTNDEKEEMSDNFAEKYDGKVQEFINFISDSQIAVPGTYKQTWKFIEKEKNSLHRHSNMHLIFKKRKT